MELKEYKLLKKNPTVQEYQFLRNAVGWSTVSDEAVNHSLKNSLFSVCMVHKNKIIAIGRVIGDAGIYYYIQDVMVLPKFQRKGLGKKIMKAIMNYLEKNADPTAFVGLMAAKGFWQFYEEYGFQKRTSDGPGMFKYLS
ncbi:MAG: GNAT family N-acetyltransferase [Candidatus Hodarchaeales archaeon]